MLGAELDVIVVRKLGVPWQPELAMGAIGEEGVRLINDEVGAAPASPNGNCPRSKPASGPSWSAAPAGSAALAPGNRWRGEPS